MEAYILAAQNTKYICVGLFHYAACVTAAASETAAAAAEQEKIEEGGGGGGEGRIKR